MISHDALVACKICLKLQLDKLYRIGMEKSVTDLVENALREVKQEIQSSQVHRIRKISQTHKQKLKEKGVKC